MEADRTASVPEANRVAFAPEPVPEADRVASASLPTPELAPEVNGDELFGLLPGFREDIVTPVSDPSPCSRPCPC